MTQTQFVLAWMTVVVALVAGGVLVLKKKRLRQSAYALLWLAGGLSIAAWTNFGRFQDVYVDANEGDTSPVRAKVREHRPFHFHEFVHYYVGPKYFQELGYFGLYDCITLAEQEISDGQHRPRRINGWVRDLEDVLTDKPYDKAVIDCLNLKRPHFSNEQWESFKNDIRELTRLVYDGAWQSVIYDAGFNPPPGPILLTSWLTSLVPVRSYLLVTSLDLLLLVACFFALRRAFGKTTAVLVAIYFGASLISHYSWNVGSVLRFSWLTYLVFGLGAMKLERWRLAGILLGLATCDRIFPGAFAVFAMIPVALRARRSPLERKTLRDYGIGFVATIGIVVVLSSIVFGFSSWQIFFSRIGRHSDVYYVMHLGLKKVLTYRDWVPTQNFHGHEGLMHFRDWNLRLRETWASIRPLALLVQALLAGGAAWASASRRPYEAALLGGVVCMFAFSLPANYYFCVLALVPAIIFRGAATAVAMKQRGRELVAFAAFNLFWLFTLQANRIWRDAIISTFYLCVAFLAFLAVWIVVWSRPRSWLAQRLQ